MIEISAKERKKILKSLRGGTVPNQGILRLAVGRNNELNAILKDCEDISEGLNSFWIFIGDYGTGKTFLLSLAREYAQKKNICTCHADLDPQKRLHSNKGDALSLYRQLISNLSTRLKPNGGALKSVIEKYLKSQRINDLRDKLNELDQTSLSFDFFKVLEIYKQGITENDSYRKQACLRWLSGEYASRIDSARELGVRTIIADHNYYDALKVLTNVFVLAGYSGLLIHIDEMVNMLKISHASSRKNNMEQILRIYNDVMQSNQKNLGVYLSGTPDFLTNPRIGLYSYDALKGRLQENSYLTKNAFDPDHPVIRVEPFDNNELYLLVERVGEIYESDENIKNIVSQDMITSFLDSCKQQLGSDLYTSPRNVIKEFLDLRSVLDIDPSANWEELLSSKLKIKPDLDENEFSDDDDNELKRFTLGN